MATDRLAQLLDEFPGNYLEGDALLLPVVVSPRFPSLRLALIPDREPLYVLQGVPLIRNPRPPLEENVGVSLVHEEGHTVIPPHVLHLDPVKTCVDDELSIVVHVPDGSRVRRPVSVYCGECGEVLSHNEIEPPLRERFHGTCPLLIGG